MANKMNIISGMDIGDMHKFKFSSKEEANMFAAAVDDYGKESNKVFGFYFGSGGSFRLIFYVMVERLV